MKIAVILFPVDDAGVADESRGVRVGGAVEVHHDAVALRAQMGALAESIAAYIITNDPWGAMTPDEVTA